jgi:NAD(P)-dependent dehydrogenase (short-subunit alcohol dehydrogenase family)
LTDIGCPKQYIDTPLLENLSPAILQGIIARIPTGRLGSPEEIGNAIVFLASYLSSFMTGQGLVVDGYVPRRTEELCSAGLTSDRGQLAG